MTYGPKNVPMKYKVSRLKLSEEEVSQLVKKKDNLERLIIAAILLAPNARIALINIIMSFQKGEVKPSDVFYTTLNWIDGAPEISTDKTVVREMADSIIPKLISFGSKHKDEQVEIVNLVLSTKTTFEVWRKVAESMGQKDRDKQSIEKLLQDFIVVRNTLVEYLMPFARNFTGSLCAKDKFVREHKNDIIQELTFRSIRAVAGYNLNKETTLTTYATYWYHQGVQRFREAHSRTIRVSSVQFELISKIGRMRRELESSLRREPTTREIAIFLDIPEYKVEEAMLSFAAPAHIDRSIPGLEDSDASDNHDILPNKNAENPEEVGVKRWNEQELHEAMSDLLVYPENLTLGLRNGLHGWEEHSLKQISNVMNISLERARQYEKEAKRKLKEGAAAFLSKIYEELQTDH